MRRRLVISTIAIVLVVLGAMAVPVGLIVNDAAEEQLDARLQEQVNRITSLISLAASEGSTVPIDDLAGLLGPRDGLEVYTPGGGRSVDLRLSSPGESRFATQTAVGGALVVVSTDVGPLDDDIEKQFQILLIVALGGIAAAAGLAAVQGHQLARPLERLAGRASRIGDGDFSQRPPIRSQIPEIDRTALALSSAASRVDALLSTERHFTADATHQLRTGIAGIAMRLELLSLNADPEVATEARTLLDQTDQLNQTIDELLALARNRSTRERSIFDLTELATAHAQEWTPRFQQAKRRLSVVVVGTPSPVLGTKGLAGQVIMNLIENSLRHGEGEVVLAIDGPSITISDEGRGISDEEAAVLFDGPVDPSARHGRGLPLARRLAQVDGGDLSIVTNRPLSLRFTLVRGDHGTSHLQGDDPDAVVDSLD